MCRPPRIPSNVQERTADGACLCTNGTPSDEAKSKLRRVFGIEPNVLGIEIGGPVHRLPRSEADL